MTARLFLRALVLALLGIAGCGGGPRAALQVTPYPGDYETTPRRLESLARTFENTFGCTETDTIVVAGVQPGVYAVSGCNASREYMLSCGPGGYAGQQRCEWAALPEVGRQAAVDMNCQPAMLEIQAPNPTQRVIEGCGFRAVYMMQCAGGGCAWMLTGRIEQAQGLAGGSYVQ